MRAFLVAVAAAAALSAAGVQGSGAMPLDLAGVHAGSDRVGSIDRVQLFWWGGRRYCWYDDGWRGPGWYWCGYAHRYGYGWGGPFGWHGWHHGRIYRGHRGPEHRYFGHPGPRRSFKGPGGPGPGISGSRGPARSFSAPGGGPRGGGGHGGGGHGGGRR